MGQFYVNTSTLNQQSRALSEVSSDIQTIKHAVGHIADGMSGIGIGGAAPAVLAIEQGLARYVTLTSTLSTTLASIVLKYITAESEIMGIPVFLNPNFAETAGTIYENTVDNITRMATDNEVYCWLSDYFAGATDGDTSNGEWSLGGYSDDIASYGTSDWDDLVDSANTVHLVEWEQSVGVSYWSADGSIEGAYGSLSGEVGFLNAGAGVNAYAGLFDADGNFAPGFGASAEASVSLFEASGEGRLGNQYLGLYGTAGVEVCSATAEASVDIGLYDSTGAFNPSLAAGLSAEAVLAQVEGSAGVTLMGTDIGVNGSIGFGAGAHANVGLQDGVLTLELGAYLGVGATVGFEVDFGGAYDTMVDAWDATTEFVGDAWDATTDFVSDAWDATTDFVDDAWDFITFWD